LISSNSLSGRFGFATDAQAQAEGQQTDAQKRTAMYFYVLLWATAILAVVRYSSLHPSTNADSRVVWSISRNWDFFSVAGESSDMHVSMRLNLDWMILLFVI
jgi:hypothetical protein